jgi:hypothetical protein
MIMMSETDFELRDALRTLRFTGALLAEVSTRADASLRWTEFELYSVATKPGSYVLYIAGLSVVYHQPGSSCNKGVATPMNRLPDDAEPCRSCRPPARHEASGDAQIDFEEDRLSLTVCSDVDQVRRELAVSGRSDRRSPLSMPANRLLQLAMQKDPAFRPEHNVEVL